MEMNQKRIVGEFELPEEVIQHIQSYMLDERDAARTTLLNKAWHRAWLTRPNLNFDQYKNEFQRGAAEFEEYTRKTMQRYEDPNLNIQTFRLRMIRYEEHHSLPSELILKAIKLGAHNLNIRIQPKTTRTRFVLPDEVLQSQTLTRLSVSDCKIDLERIIRKKEVIITFPKLKSLHLSQVYVTGDLFGDLISRCPSIEELTSQDLGTSLDDTPLSFDVAKLTQLHKLKYLKLEGLDIGDSLFRSDLWPKFACLKELVISFSFYYKHGDFRICSTSLERLTICSYGYRNMINAEFDVPNIKMFEFQGENLPRLEASSKEWEADVEIYCSLRSNVSALWFSSLNRLAKMLGRSRVSLYIFLYCDQGSGDGYVGDSLAIPALENLTIMGSYTMSPAFLDALFCSCRSNIVTIERKCVVGFERANVEEFPRLSSLPWEEWIDASQGPTNWLRASN